MAAGAIYAVSLLTAAAANTIKARLKGHDR